MESKRQFCSRPRIEYYVIMIGTNNAGLSIVLCIGDDWQIALIIINIIKLYVRLYWCHGAAEKRAKSVADLGPVPVLLLQSAFDFSTTSVCAIRLSLRTPKFAHFFINFIFFYFVGRFWHRWVHFLLFKSLIDASTPRIGIFIYAQHGFLPERVCSPDVRTWYSENFAFFIICNSMCSIISNLFPGTIVIRFDQHTFALRTSCASRNFFMRIFFLYSGIQLLPNFHYAFDLYRFVNIIFHVHYIMCH